MEKITENESYMYQLAGLSDCENLDLQSFLFHLKSIGIESTEVYSNKNTRDELQGQPKFKEICGPMYNGKKNGSTIIRYETTDLYDSISRS